MTVEEILEKLVAFPVLGGESNLTIISWIKDYIEFIGVETRLVYNSEKTKASIHCRIGEGNNGGVVLSGHTDVVPVAGQKWLTDPFVLTRKEDAKLYGRGSCDMKGFIACCLYLLPQFVKANLKAPIYFAFSYDEEIGCLGATDLIEDIKKHYHETPKFAIIGEPTMMEPIVGQKGICVLKTKVNGSEGHSSRIKQEVSAIHEASKLIVWLDNKMQQLIDVGHLDTRFHPPHTSIHIGQINGGIAPNIIADTTEFIWDVRVIPKDSLPTIIAEFESHCALKTKELQKLFPSFKIETEQLHPPVPCLDTNKDSDIVKLLAKINPNLEVKTVAYAAEAGQFSEGGFESIICGPGSIAQAHRANEFIEKEQLQKCIEMLGNLISILSK